MTANRDQAGVETGAVDTEIGLLCVIALLCFLSAFLLTVRFKYIV